MLLQAHGRPVSLNDYLVMRGRPNSNALFSSGAKSYNEVSRIFQFVFINSQLDLVTAEAWYRCCRRSARAR